MKSIAAPWIAGLTFLAWTSCKDEGVLYLTSVNEEASGANCADGGSKLSFGADGDADGQLSASEVTASAYVCDSAASRGAIVTSAPLQTGNADCPQGGYGLSVGVDANGNGTVDANEGGVTRNICNGGNGTPGASGDAGPPGAEGDPGTTGPEGPQGLEGPRGPLGDAGAPGPIGETGPAGDPGADGEEGDPGDDGEEGDPGADGADGDPGADGEAGPQGDAGPPGAPGTDGFNLVFLLSAEPAGVNCLDPGTRMDVGLDDGEGDGIPRDGILQAGEIDDTAFLCDAPPPPPLLNAGFDTDLTSWTTSGSTSPNAGRVDLRAHPTSFVAQDIDLTGFRRAAVAVDWITNTDFDSGCYFATTPVSLSVIVEPGGGGPPLLTVPLATCGSGSLVTVLVPSPSVVDISSVANQPVRIKVQIGTANDYHVYLNSVNLQ